MTLNEISELYAPHVKLLLADSAGVEYTAFHLHPDAQAFSTLAPDEAEPAILQIRLAYTFGILERCHLVAITSLARLTRWLDAAVAMKAASNALAFSASLRGYLEAAADANDVMRFLPSALKAYASYFCAVIERPELVARTAVAFGPLEQKLIHFAYASRRPKVGPIMPDHAVEATTAYIRDFERTNQVPGVEALYAHLCEITHPAAASVFTFLESADATTVFRLDRDSEVIRSICDEYEIVIQELISRGFNAPLLSLGMLGLINPGWSTASAQWVGTIGDFAQQLQTVRNAVAIARDPACTQETIQATMVS